MGSLLAYDRYVRISCVDEQPNMGSGALHKVRSTHAKDGVKFGARVGARVGASVGLIDKKDGA